MKRIFYSILMIALCSSYAFAQSISVTGTVKSSADGMPLPGVNVLVKNTSNGAVTDFDGNFSLSSVSQNSIIVFTYIGFKTQELAATANMQVNLEEDNESLDEVVLIGYGSKSRKDLTGLFL
jgi:iron complex outermembrane receptor protein